ncbi:MAG: ferric reductase-like transmembrane domain-containing protein [Actinomycetes bacterium]
MSAVGRHVGTSVLTLVLLLVFWASRPEWSPEMRLWRAVGDTAIVLLFASLALGPAARLSSRAGRLLPWRRPVGVWAALAAALHALLVLNGWARWSVRRLLGYEFLPELGREARLEPGFGLANLIGLVALVWLLLLLATSSDRAVRFLGAQAWKWLHTGAYVVFYLTVLHAAYFLYIHYTVSFHRAPVPENWFRVPLLVLGALVVALQWAAFTRTVARRRSRSASRPSTPR